MEKVFVKSEPMWESEDTEASDMLKTELDAGTTAPKLENISSVKMYDTMLKIEPDSVTTKNNASSDNINDTIVLKTDADIDNIAPKLEDDASSNSEYETDAIKTETDYYRMLHTTTEVENYPTHDNMNAKGLETGVDADNTENNASSESTNNTVLLKTEPYHCNRTPKLEIYPSPINIAVTVLKTELAVENTGNNASLDVLKTEADVCKDKTRKVNSTSSNIENTGPEPISIHVKKPKRKYKTKPRKEHACEICSKKYKHNFLLRNHKRTHSGEKPFTCETCNKSFTQKIGLKNHQRTHTGEKPFNCDFCNKPFAYKTHLVEHIRIHTGENPYSCKVCNKRFKRKTHLSLHELNHMNKPYACKTCNKKFTQEILLTRHERIHTGEKPFSCDICQKRFAEKPNLTKHIRVHTGEKPYFCITCGNRFSQKYHLASHELIHVRDMPYSCDVCKKRFRLKSNWRKHMREH